MKFSNITLIILAGGLLLTPPIEVKAQSNQTVSTNIPTPAINRPELAMGSRGEFVQELQAALKLLGFYDAVVDGIYGENTALAVTRFQQNALLNATGLVNQQTWNRLFPMSNNTFNPPTVTVATSPPVVTSTPPATTPSNSTPTTPASNNTNSTNTTPTPQTNSTATVRAENLPLLKEGMRGDEVKLLQQKLKELGFYNSTIDGIFGRNTLQAVIAAQIYFRLDGDGIVGVQTWKKILGQS
jgi:N-acetylmuramoyl-L-alanine amidase